MAKLNKILESIENLKLTTEVALLENTDVSDLVRAQSKLMINENINFIKNELTKGGILEDVQLMLKNAWTQTLMEDIGLDMTNFENAPDKAIVPINPSAAIKSMAVEAQNKIFPHLAQSYAGGGMNNGQPSIIGQHVDAALNKFKNSEFANNAQQLGQKVANNAQQLGQTIQAKAQAAADGNLPRYTQNDMNTSYDATSAANDAAIANGQRADAFEKSQAGLIDTLNQPGARAGIYADNAINKTKEIYHNAQNVAGNHVGRPVTDFEMGTAGVGALGAGLAAKSLLGRVRRG